MFTLRRCALVLIAIAVAATAGTGMAAASSAPKIPKIKTRIAKVQINVSGYVETRVLHDTTSDCFPGERWIQTNRYDFASGGFVNVSMKRVTGDGFDPIVTSPFSKRGGSAKIAGSISEYRTTNYCTGEQAKNAPAPVCSSTSGSTSVSLQEGVVPKAGDDDLQPLTSTPLMLAIQRHGGGRDADGCVGPGASQVSGEDTERSVVSTSMAPAVSLVVPSGLSVIKVFGIRPGQRMRRAILVSGPCSNVSLSTVPAPGSAPPAGGLNADGDCFLTAKLSYTITPRPKKK